MNISEATIKVTSEDLISIIQEVILLAKIKGLEISSMVFDEGMLVLKGTYKFKIKIPFEIKLRFIYLEDNLLKLKIEKISIAKLGIFSFIKKFALKKALKDFMVIGIITYKDQVCIELNTLFTIIPYVTLQLNEINVSDEDIFIKIKEISFNMDKKYVEFEEAMKRNEKIQNVWELNLKKEKNEEKVVLNAENKVEDRYTLIRDNIENSVTCDYKDLLKYALIIPDIMALIYRLIKDKRVENKYKIILGGVITYIASPIDIIPDKIPFIGKVDELALIFFALDKIINQVPDEVILQNWEGEENIILTIKEGVKVITSAVGGNNVDKVFNYINFGIKNI